MLHMGASCYPPPSKTMFVCVRKQWWVGCFALFAGCSAPSSVDGDTEAGETTAETMGTVEVPRLAEKYAAFFPIGAAVDRRSYQTHADLVTTHFNSITAENEMKPESLQRNEGTFTFAAPDAMADFAAANGMNMRGHALVWHSQNPSWFFVDENGDAVAPEVLLTRMQSHISEVVGHFRGRVREWDVVNEAIMGDGSYRTGAEEEESQRSRWFEILGEEYIAAAFRYAHEADPEAKLFYNDYHNHIPEKQQGIYDMLKGLLDAGVPVHGVGLQAHLRVAPSPDPTHHSAVQTAASLERAIQMYASLGLEVQITELDVSLYLGGVEYTEADYYTLETFTEQLQQQQAARYAEMFEMFRRNAGAITGVTFWGVADDDTWLSERVSGRDDFPLLFDVNHQPKPAFHAVVDF